MTVYYVDTSALMKRYLREAGSQWMDQLLARAATEAFFSTSLVSVELIAAVSRAHREKRISQKRRDALAVQIAQEWRLFLMPSAVTNQVITIANQLALVHPLRAYDAIHLASALLVRGDSLAQGFEAPIFLSADTALLIAAKREGFITDNPNDHA